MPYPSEHAARVRDPGDFQPDSFRRKEIAVMSYIFTAAELTNFRVAKE